MSGRRRSGGDDQGHIWRVPISELLGYSASPPPENLARSRSQTRRNMRSRSRAAPTNQQHRSRSRSETGRDRSRSSSAGRVRQGSEERHPTIGIVPGTLLAGVESHLLLLRRSLLLLSHLARPPTPELRLLEDKPPAPPTSSTFIDNIPESRITTTGVECSICLAKFRRGTKASVLPCKHQFHNKCIRPWLKKKNSCPLCRHKLPSDEPLVRRIDSSFLNIYDDFNSFSEAIRATRARVLLNRRVLPDAS